MPRSGGRARTRHRYWLTGGEGSTPLAPCGQPYAEGQAVTFASGSDYLTRAVNTDLNTPSGGFVWVNFRGALPTGNALLMGKYHSGSPGTQGEYCVIYTPGAAAFQAIRVDTANNVVGVTNNTATLTVAINTWYLVWWHFISTTMQLFVNNAHGNSNGFAGTMRTNMQPFRIGRTGDDLMPISQNGNAVWVSQAAILQGLNLGNEAAARAAVYNSGNGVRYAAMDGTTQALVTSIWELDETAAAPICCDWKASVHLTKAGTVGTTAGKI